MAHTRLIRIIRTIGNKEDQKVSRYFPLFTNQPGYYFKAWTRQELGQAKAENIDPTEAIAQNQGMTFVEPYIKKLDDGEWYGEAMYTATGVPYLACVRFTPKFANTRNYYDIAIILFAKYEQTDDIS